VLIDPSSDGIVPERELESKNRYCVLVRVPYVAGIVPEKLFSEMSIYERLLKLLKEGNVPLN